MREKNLKRFWGKEKGKNSVNQNSANTIASTIRITVTITATVAVTVTVTVGIFESSTQALVKCQF